MPTRLLPSTAVVAALCLGLGPTGCSDHSPRLWLPVSPTAPSAPAAAVTAERWSLTTTYLGAHGGEACPGLGSPPVGAATQWTLTIDRAGERLVLSLVNHSNLSDRPAYSGTTDGEAFTVTTGVGGGTGMICGDARVGFRDEARVTGRFADGGRSLEADEVYSTWLESGATLTWHSKWHATRP